MQMTFTGRYILLPVNLQKPVRRVRFYGDGVLVFDFDAHLDYETPANTMYYCVEELRGKTCTMVAEDFPLRPFLQTDEKPEADRREMWRPSVHFTASRGWNNDPNGLIFTDGVYHLFFQHNPAEPGWGNMSWGHATSADLLHWKEQDIALYPDDMGAMFSGSAILDAENRTGLGLPGVPPILLYYTAAGGYSARSEGKQFCQCLAYSTDGGKTFRKYAENPVIPHIEAENRDPKIIWCEELNAYVLALYLDGHTYALFRSDDLLHFTPAQKLDLPLDGECPDFYPLNVENEPGVRKWVFSGATDTYIVGDIDPSRNDFFVPSQKNLPYYRGNRQSYAAQTFSGMPTADCRIKMAWEIYHAPDSVFECEMSLPVRVTLRKCGEEYRLRTEPVPELAGLYAGTVTFEGRELSGIPLEYRAYEALLTAEPFDGTAALSFLGHTLKVVPGENKAEIDGYSLPLSPEGNGVHLRLIVDTLGYSLFADEGLLYTAHSALSDYAQNTLSLQADAPVRLTLHPLRSVYD